MASLGAPLMGDPLYKGGQAGRLMLHAYKISFKHPETGAILKFTAPRPRIFKEILTDGE